MRTLLIALTTFAMLGGCNEIQPTPTTTEPSPAHAKEGVMWKYISYMDVYVDPITRCHYFKSSGPYTPRLKPDGLPYCEK